MENNELLKEAIQASTFAHIPYSKFAVGAALLLEDGKIIHGCNIENASYGLTNCAERTALFKAVSLGYCKRQIKKIAVVADCKKAIAPCGACRQVMLELTEKNCPVILSNLKLSEIIQTTVGELLPYSFSGF